jgi:hypothetical protein
MQLWIQVPRLLHYQPMRKRLRPRKPPQCHLPAFRVRYILRCKLRRIERLLQLFEWRQDVLGMLQVGSVCKQSDLSCWRPGSRVHGTAGTVQRLSFRSIDGGSRTSQRDARYRYNYRRGCGWRSWPSDRHRSSSTFALPQEQTESAARG